MSWDKHEGCSCHTSPPCEWCLERPHCMKCDEPLDECPCDEVERIQELQDEVDAANTKLLRIRALANATLAENPTPKRTPLEAVEALCKECHELTDHNGELGAELLQLRSQLTPLKS